MAAFPTAGDDNIDGTAGPETIDALAGNDIVNGLDGNDDLDGGDDDDTINGDSGDDLLRVSGFGIENVNGGADNDTIVVDYSDATTNIVANFDSGSVRFASSAIAAEFVMPSYSGTITDGAARRINYSGIEKYIITTGSGEDDILVGYGDDIISSGAGDDFIRLQVGGNDQVDSGDGDDMLYYADALDNSDVNFGGAGTRDVLILQGQYNEVLTSNALNGIEYLSLQSGSVTRFGDNNGGSYDYSLAIADSAVAAGQRLTINGQSLLSGEDMDVNGSAESDGTFLVYAGNGGDHLTGGANNDIFYFEGSRFAAGDTANGGGGRDAVVITGAISGMNNITIGDGVFTSIEAISVNGRFASDPSVVPSYNLVIGNNNATSGTLTVNASSLGETQSATIDASAVTDGMLSIFGGAGVDLLIGGALADTIMGGLSGDTLYGGAGDNSFRYDSILESNSNGQDGIQDFTLGDKIDLSRIDAIAGTPGNDAFTFVGDLPFSGAAGELRAVQIGGSLWSVLADVDGDKLADFVVAVVVTDVATHPLTGADFVL